MTVNDIEFANPGFLYLFILVPLLAAWYWYRNRKHHADLQVPSMDAWQKNGKSIKEYLYHGLFGLRLLAVALLILALARPQTSTRKQDVTIEGIDIVLAMDISGSMLAEDFQPNRLEASKKVAGEFVTGRPNDRVGLVVFSGETFTQCPLTTDHTILINLFIFFRLALYFVCKHRPSAQNIEKPVRKTRKKPGRGPAHKTALTLRAI